MKEEVWFVAGLSGASGVVLIAMAVAAAIIMRGCSEADATRMRSCTETCGEHGVLIADPTTSRASCVCRP